MASVDGKPESSAVGERRRKRLEMKESRQMKNEDEPRSRLLTEKLAKVASSPAGDCMSEWMGLRLGA